MTCTILDILVHIYNEAMATRLPRVRRELVVSAQWTGTHSGRAAFCLLLWSGWLSGCASPTANEADGGLPEPDDVQVADIDLGLDGLGTDLEKLRTPVGFLDRRGAHDIRLTIPAAAWKTLLANAEDVKLPRTYHKAEVQVGADKWSNVGVKNFGDGSQLDWWQKPNLRIKFNIFDDTQKGPAKLRNLRLKASGGDHAFLREPYTYDIFRGLGAHAPRFSFARVWINGDFYGLYQLLEHIDKRFFKYRFGNTKGLNYDPAGSCYGFRCPDKGCAALAGKYDVEPIGGKFDKLVAVADVLKNAPDGELKAKLGALVDLDQLLAVYAVEAYLGEVDGLMASGANFEIYQDEKTGLLHVFRHGADSTLSHAVDFDTPWPDPNKLCKSHTDPFWPRAWKHPELGKLLRAKLRKLQCEVMTNAKVAAWFEPFAYTITNELIVDPHGPKDPKPNVLVEISGIKTWVAQRNLHVGKLLGGCK